MIGWSGRELEPVVGPGQVAPGMAPDTLERLRRWQVRAKPAPPSDWRRAGERFGRPVGLPKVLRGGTVRQPFERAVLELAADGSSVRLMSLGQLAVRAGLVPEGARRLEPVPGLPARPASTAAEQGPFLWLLAAGLGLLGLGGVVVDVLAGRP
jgi:hypothetical protein